MPLTLRARTLLKWNSNLGSTYRASPRRRKALGWQSWGYAYSFACLLFFDRMLLVCGNLSCSERFLTSAKKQGSNDLCQSNGSTVSELCDCLNNLKSEEQRKHLLEKYHLNFCDILSFGKHLAFLSNSAQCTENLKRILSADCNASQYNSKFEEIVGRIDCADRYSVRWNCVDCKIAYKEWLCTTTVLPQMLNNGKTACKEAACEKVMQRCPYFLPNSDTQWSGQSLFDCETDHDHSKPDHTDCIHMLSPPSKVQNSSSQTSISKSHHASGS